ncbi:MAG TPA: hypothetical protein VJ276_24410 [Thermoanaerobaculia bacterium]|nr:hypothetical protein [Thermoanaerobaculia bacterium]
MRPFALALLLLISLPALAATDLTGTVVDPAAKPVRGAHVYVYAAFPKLGISSVCPNCYRDCGKHEPVNAKGNFRLEALDEMLYFDVLAVADGYEPAFASRVDPKGGPVRIELRRRSIEDADRLVTGLVLDPKGKPVVGAAVEPSGYHAARGVGYGNIPGLDKLSITNGKGEFALRMPEAGTKLDVRVTARALAPRIDRLLVPGERRTIRMTEGAAITGHLTRDGKPLAGARIAFMQRNRASSGYLGRVEIGTNDAGFFMMTNLGPNETYVVFAPEVTDGVVAPKLVTVGADGTSADAGTLTVGPGRRVAGRLVLPEGESLSPGTQITLTGDFTATSRTVTPGEDATFAFDGVPAEPSHVMVKSVGVRRPSTVAVPAEGEVKDLRLVFGGQ